MLHTSYFVFRTSYFVLRTSYFVSCTLYFVRFLFFVFFLFFLLFLFSFFLLLLFACCLLPRFQNLPSAELEGAKVLSSRVRGILANAAITRLGVGSWDLGCWDLGFGMLGSTWYSTSSSMRQARQQCASTWWNGGQRYRLLKHSVVSRPCPRQVHAGIPALALLLRLLDGPCELLLNWILDP